MWGGKQRPGLAERKGTYTDLVFQAFRMFLPHTLSRSIAVLCLPTRSAEETYRQDASQPSVQIGVSSPQLTLYAR